MYPSSDNVYFLSSELKLAHGYNPDLIKSFHML